MFLKESFNDEYAMSSTKDILLGLILKSPNIKRFSPNVILETTVALIWDKNIRKNIFYATFHNLLSPTYLIKYSDLF